MVHYRVSGEGDEALVLVHGLCASYYWWVRNVPSLSRHYRVYLIDLPGFGSMRHLRHRFALPSAADWLYTWMQAVGLSQAHFIGHSMGGVICLSLAAQHPESVSRLILVAPALIPDPRLVRQYIVPLIVGCCYTAPSFYPILAYDAARTGIRMLLQTTREILSHDMREELHMVKAPTFLIWGEHDTLVPVQWAPDVQKEIRGAHLFILQRAGHVCMFDRARDFNQQVLAFLQDEAIEGIDFSSQ